MMRFLCLALACLFGSFARADTVTRSLSTLRPGETITVGGVTFSYGRRRAPVSQSPVDQPSTQGVTAGDNPTTWTATWTSGGVTHVVTERRNPGESNANFARRCKDTLTAQLAVFPVDPQGSGRASGPGGMSQGQLDPEGTMRARWRTPPYISCSLSNTPEPGETTAQQETRLRDTLAVFTLPEFFPRG